MQFLGTLFGDHVKTGIGLRLTTGTVLGAGANVYGDMPPKAVAPFSWGDGAPYAMYRADKFVETAARVMARRHVELTRARPPASRPSVHARPMDRGDDDDVVKLWMLGSGSSGNAVLIECDGSRILIDCGFGTRTLAGRLKTIGVEPRVDRRVPHHARAHRPRQRRRRRREALGLGRLRHARDRARARELAGTHGAPVRAGHDHRVPAHDRDEHRRRRTTPTQSVGFVVTSRSTGARAGLFYDIGHVSRAIADACDVARHSRARVESRRRHAAERAVPALAAVADRLPHRASEQPRRRHVRARRGDRAD